VYTEAEGAQQLHSCHRRCVSIFLDTNRHYIGKSQSTRPPKRTQRRAPASPATLPAGRAPSRIAPLPLRPPPRRPSPLRAWAAFRQKKPPRWPPPRRPALLPGHQRCREEGAGLVTCLAGGIPSHHPPIWPRRCVSIFLDTNRHYIGKSQSTRPTVNTHRPGHIATVRSRLPSAAQLGLDGDGGRRRQGQEGCHRRVLVGCGIDGSHLQVLHAAASKHQGR
jgi:hypothetical protein